MVTRVGVELIRLGIFCVAAQCRSLLGDEIRRQSRPDFRGNRILHRENVAELLFVTVRPELLAVVDSEQARRHPQLTGIALNVAFEHRVHTERSTGGQRVLLRTRVAAHRTQRTHHQIAGVEPGNQRLGHAELERLVAIRGGQRLERQDCERRHRARRSLRGSSGTPEGDQGGHGDQQGHAARGRQQQPAALPAACTRRDQRWGRIGSRLGCFGCDSACRCADHIRDELVATSRHGRNEALPGRFVFQSAAQCRDRDVEIAVVDHRRGPQGIGQRLACDQLTRMGDQMHQRIE